MQQRVAHVSSERRVWQVARSVRACLSFPKCLLNHFAASPTLLGLQEFSKSELSGMLLDVLVQGPELSVQLTCTPELKQ